MRRYLTWHRDSPRGNGGREGPVYYADRALAPGNIRLHANKAPDAGDLQIDIRSDGTSILSSLYARLTKGDSFEEEAQLYSDTVPNIAEGSEITFHIISTGGAEDITCTLEADDAEDDEDT
jgi:hypothetical protein